MVQFCDMPKKHLRNSRKGTSYGQVSSYYDVSTSFSMEQKSVKQLLAEVGIHHLHTSISCPKLDMLQSLSS